ncbi:MAG: preprotein translocase subunit SecG [Candidatus Obscuribacterales bacterium]|jgi:preprotein translocase subunit SecG|nr:preprotein translocase subunit SecG [Candidatus Obscuribacterales bacterium]
MSVAYTVLLVAQAVLGLIMILLVLLHAPKGEGMGGIGGTATMFTGRRGAEGGLDKLTWGIFLLFLILCVLSGFGIVK